MQEPTHSKQVPRISLDVWISTVVIFGGCLLFSLAVIYLPWPLFHQYGTKGLYIGIWIAPWAIGICGLMTFMQYVAVFKRNELKSLFSSYLSLFFGIGFLLVAIQHAGSLLGYWPKDYPSVDWNTVWKSLIPSPVLIGIGISMLRWAKALRTSEIGVKS